VFPDINQETDGLLHTNEMFHSAKSSTVQEFILTHQQGHNMLNNTAQSVQPCLLMRMANLDNGESLIRSVTYFIAAPAPPVPPILYVR